MRFLDDREFPTTQDALLFYAAFVLAWAVFLPPVFWVCVELARALCLCCKYIAFAFAATLRRRSGSSVAIGGVQQGKKSFMRRRHPGKK